MRRTRKQTRARRKRSRRARQYKSRGGAQEKSKVIGGLAGGLGDHLALSTLPEMYVKNGYTVYISDTQEFRSDEIYDLVWKLNPFVKGKSNLPVNVTPVDRPWGPNDGNFIKYREIQCGVTNGYRKYPVVYYTPKRIAELADYLIVDSGSVSANEGNADYAKSFQTIYDKYPHLERRLLKFKLGYKGHKSFTPKNNIVPTYEIENMYHLCDVLFTCKVFVSGVSGSSHLASAIKQDSPTPEIYSFYSGPMPSNVLFKMDNVNYAPVVI